MQASWLNLTDGIVLIISESTKLGVFRIELDFFCYQVMNAASRPYKGPDKRRKKEYQCNVCKGWFAQKEVAIDHIKPCGTLKTFEDLPSFVSTLFCEQDNLQCICSACHSIKTQEERKKK